MFNVGGGEIVVLLLLALLLLGPEKLPEAARKVGKVLAEIRRVTGGFEEEVRSAMDLGPKGKVVDLLDSTTAGPTLTGPKEPVAPPSAPTSSGRVGSAFVADLGPDDTGGDPSRSA